MEKLSLTIENELAIITKYHLTAEEWMIVRLLLLASEEEGRKEYLAQYLSYRMPQLSLREILESLQVKGIILKSYKLPKAGAEFDPSDIPFNSVFLNNYFKFSAELGGDLFEHYPNSMIINGVVHFLRTPSKKFRDLNDLLFGYGKAIKNNPELHKEVLSLLEWGKEHDLINMGMAEFVASRAWLSLKDMREGNGVTINMDTIKCL